MLPGDIPAIDDQRGTSSVSGTSLQVKGQFRRPTRRSKTLRDTARQSATTDTNRRWNPLHTHLGM
jgi:hypothetical protein